MGRNHQDSEFDRARDELYSHIHRCDVLDATEEQQREWMAETLEFIGERHPELSPEQLDSLKELGLRFCQPAIPHGTENTAVSAKDGETG